MYLSHIEAKVLISNSNLMPKTPFGASVCDDSGLSLTVFLIGEIRMVETWKPVFGYEGLYEVSSEGRVRSLTHTVSFSNGGIMRSRTFLGRVLRPEPNVNGRMHVRLSKVGEVRQWMIHRLVATAFHGEAGSDLQVNHKDGDKLNNRADNLEWVTQAENVEHARLVLRKQDGESNPLAILTSEDVKEIRRLYVPGSSFYHRGNALELANRFGVSRYTIINAALGRSWRSV